MGGRHPAPISFTRANADHVVCFILSARALQTLPSAPDLNLSRPQALPPLLLDRPRQLVGLGVGSLALPPGVVKAIAQVIIVRILDGRGQRRRSTRDGTQRHLHSSSSEREGQTLSRAEGGG